MSAAVEVVEKAARAMYADFEACDWENGDLQTLLAYRRAARIALEAAEPASVASRERVAEVAQTLLVDASDPDISINRPDALSFADALLTAGVFRSLPTQDELTEWLREIFTADPGGTPFGTAAEELLRLLSGDES